MPEHRLHRTQIGTVFQQMGGKGMAQGMRGNVLEDAGLQGAALDNLPEALACQPLPGAIEKEEGLSPSLSRKGRPRAEIMAHFGQGRFAEGNDPLFAAFAEGGQITGIELQIADLEGNQFGDAQAGGVENFEHRPVAQIERCLAGRRFEQAFDLGRRAGYAAGD